MSVWIPLQEAAKILGVDRKTVWRWTKNVDDPDNSGLELQGHQAPGSDMIYIKQDDLDEFMRLHEDDIGEYRDRE